MSEEQRPTDTSAAQSIPPANSPPAPPEDSADDLPPPDDGMVSRLERLGGEPAPAISPEEFARLQESGQIHIDSRGRIRTTRREETDAGMSLRKRRAWYA
jgi:hypothetical protein